MVGFHVSKESITINSHKGEYSVIFNNNGISDLNKDPIANAVYIIDENLVNIYSKNLCNIIENNRCLIIKATEKNKSLKKLSSYIDELINLELKRDEKIVAIGGGIIQDITCFLSSTLMRGIPWYFYPSTLLAMADSCIGSKSSINSGDLKNILGTFNPPEKIILDVTFLKTLERVDILSGIGEMIKVHAINSPESFKKISDSYENILSDMTTMESFIKESLLMKKILIEIDEFDKKERNVMNYGHSFGHAIESATNYSIPHGISVTIGMDIANYVAAKLGVSTDYHFERMHDLLSKNSSLYDKKIIDSDLLIKALNKDKKNTKSQLRLILPDKKGEIGIGLYDKSQKLKKAVDSYLTEYK